MCNIDHNENFSYRCWKKLKNEQTLLNMNFVSQHELVKNAKIFTYGTSEVVFTKFFEILAQVLNKYVPKETKKSTKRPKKCWVDNKVKKECQRKKKLYQEYIHCKTQENWLKFKQQRNKAKAVIRQTKRKYFDVYLSCKEEQGNKNFYKTMKSLKPSSASLNDNDLSPNCEVFNTFFSTIGSDLYSKFDSSPNFSLIDKVPATMLLLGANEKEIECIIDKLSNKISEDQYGISNKSSKIHHSTPFD